MPAKLKGLFDRALLPGRAFDTRDTDWMGMPTPMLSGRTGRVIVTEQGDEVAALVPLKDLQKLMGLDGEIDLAAAKQLLDKQLRRD